MFHTFVLELEREGESSQGCVGSLKEVGKQRVQRRRGSRTSGRGGKKGNGGIGPLLQRRDRKNFMLYEAADSTRGITFN